MIRKNTKSLERSPENFTNIKDSAEKNSKPFGKIHL